MSNVSFFRATTFATAVIAALGALALGSAEASVESDVSVPVASTVTRAAVKAEVRRANQAGLLHYEELELRDPAPSMSPKTREQVRQEARAAAKNADHTHFGSYYIGGR